MNDNANLSDWTTSVSDGVSEALRKVIVGIPDILAAIVVLLIGIVVAAVMKAVVVRVVQAIKLKNLTSKVGLSNVFTAKIDMAELLGDLTKWFFIIVFLIQALSIAHLDQINSIVSKLLGYVPNVLAAAAVIFVGVVVADLTSRVVSDASRFAGSSMARLAGDVARYAILAVVALTALTQLGVNTLYLGQLFTAIVVMLALAGGLAFGLGGRDAAKDWIDNVRKAFKRD